ncbi:hypothetical protein Salat_2564200 [Sesamum alatum]|uniref:Uncharacterized protein n=1 Tax=Sesamum alatum TaxID=300844 RepID=A0AAE1XSW7_9LAMI|nr:hypothetical protein Salat_2564200 [Sesamum alatum]
MDRGSTSDWTSSGTSGPSSPPPVTRKLLLKIRGKMPRKTRASSSSENASSIPTVVSSEALAVVSSTSSMCPRRLLKNNGENSHLRELEAKFRAKIETLKDQVVNYEVQIAMLTVQNEVLTSSTVQAYTRG